MLLGRRKSEKQKYGEAMRKWYGWEGEKQQDSLSQSEKSCRKQTLLERSPVPP